MISEKNAFESAMRNWTATILFFIGRYISNQVVLMYKCDARLFEIYLVVTTYHY